MRKDKESMSEEGSQEPIRDKIIETHPPIRETVTMIPTPIRGSL